MADLDSHQEIHTQQRVNDVYLGISTGICYIKNYTSSLILFINN